MFFLDWALHGSFKGKTLNNKVIMVVYGKLTNKNCLTLKNKH
jgi:hypothetical protein